MNESQRSRFVEHAHDDEIMRVIRYLDPDSRCEGTVEKANTVPGIFISLAIVLASALAYIGLYIRTI